MQDLKNKIEAVLFMTGRAMATEEIANFCNIGSVGAIQEALNALIQDYTQRPSGLEIFFDDGKYRLNIKREYNSLSTRLVSNCELDTPTQATLALIAYKQPALQSDIIKMRGNTAYDHIHALKEMEFITTEKSGRTRKLKLASKFFEYFDVVEETLKQKMTEVAERQSKLTEEPKKLEPDSQANPEIQETEKAVEEVKEIKIAPKKRNKLLPEQVVLEIQKTSPEVLKKLNSDDFGTTA
ncbi:SMC-Scp complex subunit ScpB [Candidatus Woesearchaeota archaeon]|nr:SMC-Scp complex subunit ScpB [Candidatus Woesearchaeota archaeon]